MARGRLVLDGSTRVLEEALSDLNIIVLVPPVDALNQHRRQYLAGRILVTAYADGYVEESTAHEYGLIEVPLEMLADPVKTATSISRAVGKHRLWALGHSFLMNLESGKLRDLWAEEQGEEPR